VQPVAADIDQLAVHYGGAAIERGADRLVSAADRGESHQCEHRVQDH
jgi:hypothetical protein